MLCELIAASKMPSVILCISRLRTALSFATRACCFFMRFITGVCMIQAFCQNNLLPAFKNSYVMVMQCLIFM